MSYQQQPQSRQPNQQMQQPYGQVPYGYQPQPMKRMQRPPKKRMSFDISSMIEPRKRKFLLNLIVIGICFLLVYGVASFFVNHTSVLNSDIEGFDYMGYMNSDFLITIIPFIFLVFFYMILKGKKLNINNPYIQNNPIYQPQQQYQQPNYQQTQQQPQQQNPQFMQQAPIQQPVQHIPPQPKWNPPPNYWNPSQQQPVPQQPQRQQPVPQKTGSWKCPNCNTLNIGNFCNECGYQRRTR